MLRVTTETLLALLLICVGIALNTVLLCATGYATLDGIAPLIAVWLPIPAAVLWGASC